MPSNHTVAQCAKCISVVCRAFATRARYRSRSKQAARIRSTPYLSSGPKAWRRRRRSWKARTTQVRCGRAHAAATGFISRQTASLTSPISCRFGTRHMYVHVCDRNPSSAHADICLFACLPIMLAAFGGPTDFHHRFPVQRLAILRCRCLIRS